MKVMVLIAGLALSTDAFAQPIRRGTVDKPIPVGAHVRIAVAGVKFNGVAQPVHPVVADAGVALYDNSPTTGVVNRFFTPAVAPTGMLDHLSFDPGTAPAGPVLLATFDNLAFVAPPGFLGGDVDMEYSFFDSVNESPAATSPINTVPIGPIITLQFLAVPANTGTTGVSYGLLNPLNISAAQIIIPDRDFGVVARPLVHNSTTTHPVIAVGFVGDPNVQVGSSTDVYWRDVNGNGAFDATDVRFFNGPPNRANLELKFGDGSTTPPVLCYPNCDNSSAPPILNSLDFGCFLSKFAAGDSYANCDASTSPPILNALDFGCYLTKYAAGCT